MIHEDILQKDGGLLGHSQPPKRQSRRYVFRAGPKICKKGIIVTSSVFGRDILLRFRKS